MESFLVEISIEFSTRTVSNPSGFTSYCDICLTTGKDQYNAWKNGKVVHFPVHLHQKSWICLSKLGKSMFYVGPIGL